MAFPLLLPKHQETSFLPKRSNHTRGTLPLQSSTTKADASAQTPAGRPLLKYPNIHSQNKATNFASVVSVERHADYIHQTETKAVSGTWHWQTRASTSLRWWVRIPSSHCLVCKAIFFPALVPRELPKKVGSWAGRLVLSLFHVSLASLSQVALYPVMLMLTRKEQGDQ